MENIKETNTSEVTTEAPKQLSTKDKPKAIIRRNTDNKIIAGVCSGIADYYDIDPVIVRLIAGIGFLSFGVGPLMYLLLWIILPATQKTTQVVPSVESESLSPVG